MATRNDSYITLCGYLEPIVDSKLRPPSLEDFFGEDRPYLLYQTHLNAVVDSVASLWVDTLQEVYDGHFVNLTNYLLPKNLVGLAKKRWDFEIDRLTLSEEQVREVFMELSNLLKDDAIELPFGAYVVKEGRDYLLANFE